MQSGQLVADLLGKGLHIGQLVQGNFLGYLAGGDELREFGNLAGELAEGLTGLLAQDGQDGQGGPQAVAGVVPAVQEDDVAALFTANAHLAFAAIGLGQFEQFIGDVFIAHGGEHQGVALLLRVDLQAAVGHGGGHQRIAQKAALLVQPGT